MPSWPARRTRTAVCTMRVSSLFPITCPPSFTFSKNSKYLNFSCPSSFRQAHHVRVRVQQREHWGHCSPVYRQPDSVQDIHTVPKTNQGKTRTMYKGCWSKPIVLLYFVFLFFHFVSNLQILLLVSRDTAIINTRPVGLYSAPTPQGLVSTRSMGWGHGGEGLDRSSSEGRSLPSHRHLIQSRHHWPSNAKGAGEMVVDRPAQH